MTKTETIKIPTIEELAILLSALHLYQKIDIEKKPLKEAIKDSAGNDVKVLKDGKDRTLLDSWLYNNAEAKEFAKKEFDSGLARDGSRFIAA